MLKRLFICLAIFFLSDQCSLGAMETTLNRLNLKLQDFQKKLVTLKSNLNLLRSKITGDDIEAKKAEQDEFAALEEVAEKIFELYKNLKKLDPKSSLTFQKEKIEELRSLLRNFLERVTILECSYTQACENMEKKIIEITESQFVPKQAQEMKNNFNIASEKENLLRSFRLTSNQLIQMLDEQRKKLLEKETKEFENEFDEAFKSIDSEASEDDSNSRNRGWISWFFGSN